MNKYQESLNYIINKYMDIHYDNKAMNEDTKHALCLQELVNKANLFKWNPFTFDENGILNCELPNIGEVVLCSDGKIIWLDTWFEMGRGRGCELFSGMELKGLAWMHLPKLYRVKEIY